MPKMDENRSAYHHQVSGPGSFPRVDDHLVEPEITRDEIIGGLRVISLPAEWPQATQKSLLNYVIRGHISPGYNGATNLLTRYDDESDFGTDTCVLRDGVDPETGARYLEEIAFEVISEQKARYVTEKARRMHRRGVRRIFTIWVDDQQVYEWSAQSQRWCPLDRDSSIEDPCLVSPLPIAALFDSLVADNAVVRALAAKGNPEIQRREAVAEARATAKAILTFLDARGISVSSARRQEILSCQDADRLDRWLRRAAVATSADEVTSDS